MFGANFAKIRFLVKILKFEFLYKNKGKFVVNGLYRPTKSNRNPKPILTNI